MSTLVRWPLPTPPLLRGPASRIIRPPLPAVIVPGTPFLQNNLEGGTPGVTITIGNSGGTSGDAATSIAFNGTGADVQFSNAVTMLGSVCMACVLGSVAGEAYWQWDHTGNVLTTAYYRDHLYITAAPPASIRVITPMDTVAGVRARLFLNSSRQLFIADSLGNTLATMTATPVPLNQLVRVELRFVGSATTGELEARLYLTPSADIASYSDVISASGANTGGTTNRIRFGPNGTTVASHTSYHDAFAVAADNWIGPVAAGGQASSGAAQGATRVSGSATGGKNAAGAAQEPARTTGATTSRKQATTAAVGEQRTVGMAVRGAPAATGTATGIQRTSGTATGRKQAAVAEIGQQRSIGTAAVRKQAASAPTEQQRTTGTTAIRKQATGTATELQRIAGLAATTPPPPSGATVGQQRVSALAAGRKGSIGSGVGAQRSSGIAAGIHRTVGTATGQQRTAPIAAGIKAARGVATGLQRTDGQATVGPKTPPPHWIEHAGGGTGLMDGAGAGTGVLEHAAAGIGLIEGSGGV